MMSRQFRSMTAVRRSTAFSTRISQVRVDDAGCANETLM